MFVQCLKKVKSSLQLLHGEISGDLFPLVLSCSLWPSELDVALGIHLALLLFLPQWGQAISSWQGVAFDPTLL